MQCNYIDSSKPRRDNSIKWAFSERYLSPAERTVEPLAMWIADMDFRSPQPVVDALVTACEDSAFGYAGITASYTEAVCEWQRKRFSWSPDPQWLVQTPGVLSALCAAVQAFSVPGDTILIQPPVYGLFESVAQDNGRHIVNAPLRIQDRQYCFDPTEFESCIRSNTKIFFLCNPHNPTGGVWSEQDLRQMGEICLRHGILVVSDEVHQDLVWAENKKHTPFASLEPEFASISITCTSASKSFNLSGLQCSNIFIPDDRLRSEFERQLIRLGLYFVNPMGAIACEVSYRHGEPWLEATLAYIKANQQHFETKINEIAPGLEVFRPDATYLAWIDCRDLGLAAADLERFFRLKARVWFEGGHKFGLGGDGFMRANLGCPRSIVDEALQRIKLAMQQQS
jgi:cystathionine beta-lyase